MWLETSSSYQKWHWFCGCKRRHSASANLKEISAFFFNFIFINVYWLYIMCSIFNGVIFSSEVAANAFIAGIVVMRTMF
jgi:hypothetical protein